MESCEVEEFGVHIAIIEPRDSGFKLPIKILLVKEHVII